MKIEELRSRMALIFFDGTGVNASLVRSTISQLEALIKAMDEATQFLFYKIDLLIVYEGDYDYLRGAGREQETRVRILDFAKTLCTEEQSETAREV